MNLPKSVEDPSLLQHEPLCDHIAIVAAMEMRSASKDVVFAFVSAMQRDAQAAAAARKWAYLVFKDVLSDENSFEVTDEGVELYKAFFQYQLRLSEGLQQGKMDKVREYRARVFGRGIATIKLKDHSAKTQQSTRRRRNEGRSQGHGGIRSSRQRKTPGPKKGPCKVETDVRHPDAGSAGYIAMDSNLACGSHSTMAAAKPGKCPTSEKEKKRKAGFQEPPVITSSDLSEDDEESLGTHAVNIANSVSHQPHWIAPDSCRQSYDFLQAKVDGKNSVHRPKTTRQCHEDVSISQPQSTPTSIRSEDIVSTLRIKEKHGAKFLLKDRKHEEASVLNFSGQERRADTNSRCLRKIKSVGGLQARATKRFRGVSISAPNGKGGSKSAHDLWPKELQESTIQGYSVTGPSTQENISTESKTRPKRIRAESQIGSRVLHDKSSSDSYELLGPDTRLLRPLPKKVGDQRLVPVAGDETGVCGVPCGALSLEHADQPLQDVASSTLARLQEAVGPDVQDWTQDWTQDSEHELECDDISGHDQDEVNDSWVTAATSASSLVMPKPPAPAPPWIWAQSRQEVCESFEYFRSYHSGVYSKGDIVRGYLLGAYAASRDIFYHGGKLIISHGGGKSHSILDSRRGPRRYQTDQDQEASDKSVRALLKTCKDRRPIVLLADDKYALFPYDLTSANYTYVVLGLYWISHAWAECQSARDGPGRIVRWKFAFQWCEDQGDPWWAPQQGMTNVTRDPSQPISKSGTQGPSHPINTGGDPVILCDDCKVQSPFIYKQGWMCLNPRCNVFWSLNGEEPKQLDYREEFLSLLPRKFERLPNLTPSRVVEMPGGVTTTHAFSKGWHCTECGRLSSRYKWECWECSNCQLKYVVNGRLRSPKEFWHQRPPKGFLHSQVGKDSGILTSSLEPINLGAHKGFTNRLTFILPHDRGKIHLILGTPLSNGDADDIFRLYQQQASTGELRLRRYPLRNHKARGPLLTNYFSQNSGEPYQYVGGTGNTVPFCEAPDCVRQALALIKERSRLALHDDIPFNEVLSAAYMERQKMSFHSDSEKELGPVVASLSLGSAALMHFRQHVSIDNPRSSSPYALTLVLRHGDVLIMEGDGVQKHYEHTVVPMNFRIAATARCIGSA